MSSTKRPSKLSTDPPAKRPEIVTTTTTTAAPAVVINLLSDECPAALECCVCSTSPNTPIVCLPCGHGLHGACYSRVTGYCPTCSASMSWHHEAQLLPRAAYLAAGAERPVEPAVKAVVDAWSALEASHRNMVAAPKPPAAAAAAAATGPAGKPPTAGRGKKTKGALAADRAHARSPWASGTGFGGAPMEVLEVRDEDLTRSPNPRRQVVRLRQGGPQLTRPQQTNPAQLKRARDRQAQMDQASLPVVKQLSAAVATAKPGPQLEALLKGSPLQALSAYLNNGSVEDIDSRVALYEALMELVETLANSPCLVALLLEPTFGATPLVEALNNLTYVDRLSARAVLARDSALANAAKHPHFAHDASAIAGSAKQSRAHRKQLASLAAQVAASASATQAERESMYLKSMRPLQFRSLALLDLFQARKIGHVYLQPQPAHFPHAFFHTGGGGYPMPQHPPVQLVLPGAQRLARVRRELAALQNSMPLNWGSSAWCVVDEEKPDYFSFLLAGPEGTPYQNGLFLFDGFLPPDFPNVPPKVTLVTTGGGRVRFNPNLYKDGKVCLSLLGTWTGPSWDPKTSTVLQVIISIQSLILVPDPYFNEPGLEATMNSPHGKQASAQYNAAIRSNTIRFAMTDILAKPPYAFEEAVKLHFSLKAHEIRSQLERWQELHAQVYDQQVRGVRQQAVADLAPASTFAELARPLLQMLFNTQQHPVPLPLPPPPLSQPRRSPVTALDLAFESAFYTGLPGEDDDDDYSGLGDDFDDDYHDALMEHAVLSMFAADTSAVAAPASSSSKAPQDVIDLT